MLMHCVAGPLSRGIFLLATAALLTLSFSFIYVANEDPVYYYDWVAYFDKFKGFGRDFAEGKFLKLAVDAARSVRWDDYNPTSIMALAPIAALFGGSRTTYIASLLTLYLIPVTLLASVMANAARQASFDEPSELGISNFDFARLTPAWLFATALFYWPLWSAAVRGMPDIVGLIPLGLATLIVLHAPRFRERPIVTGIALGLLVWITFLLRRWYAFSCVSLLMLGTAWWTFVVARSQTNRAKNLKALAAAVTACGLTIVAALAIIQYGLTIRILTSNYSEAYVDFQEPYSQHLVILYDRAGPIILMGILAGLIRAIMNGAWRILFLAACALTAQILLSRVHQPYIQHILPIFFWAFPVFVYGASWPFETAFRLRPRAIWLLPAIMSISFASVFSPAVRERLQPVQAALPSTTVFPLKLENLPEYYRLVADIKQQLQPGEMFSVFASNEYLTGSLLQSLDSTIYERFHWASDVDRRDGLLFAPLEAELAVVTDRPAVSSIDRQRVISIPNELIVSGAGMGSAYERVGGPYRIAGGFSAYIHRRKRPLSEEDKLDLERRILKHYGHWRTEPRGIMPR